MWSPVRGRRSILVGVVALAALAVGATPAFGAPKPTSAPETPSSTTPIPPGVIGSEVSRRPIDQAANDSTIEICESEIPTARSDRSSTTNPVS